MLLNKCMILQESGVSSYKGVIGVTLEAEIGKIFTIVLAENLLLLRSPHKIIISRSLQHIAYG